MKLMAQFIDKDALVAEIEKRIKGVSQIKKASYEIGLFDAYKIVLHFLNTLEVKEVDLEKEFDNYAKNILACDVQFKPFTHLYNCAKYFFELGLNMQNVQNKNIWHPMSKSPDHSCTVLMHGYGNDVWIADAVETLEKGAAQEWAYMDDVLITLGLKAQKGK